MAAVGEEGGGSEGREGHLVHQSPQDCRCRERGQVSSGRPHSSCCGGSRSGPTSRTTASFSSRSRERNDLELQWISIPASKVGRVIGDEGCDTNAIRTATGAQVNLNKVEDYGEAIVTIHGQHAGMAYRLSSINL